MRFAVSGDPVSMLDMNAQTTFKAPIFSSDKMQNAVNVMTNPSLENIRKIAQNPLQSIPDPTFGLRSIVEHIAPHQNPWILLNLA